MEALSPENLNLPPLPHPAAALISNSSTGAGGTAASPGAPAPPTLPAHHPPPHPDPLRLQQHLYTLALADRMRLLQPALAAGAGGVGPFGGGMFLPGGLMGAAAPSGIQAAAAAAAAAQHLHRFSPPSDLARFPLAKLDPRLFRIPFPEEPKPQHSYIGLIAMAILSSSEKKLVLADIYQYILDNFPYFRHRGPGWRNSIRHNLSLNDCFIKSGRASNGKGHFWAVHPACQEDFQKGDFSRRKAQRKVRKYLGLNVEEEEQDTPPVSPPPSMISPPPTLAAAATNGHPFNFFQQHHNKSPITDSFFRLPAATAAALANLKEESFSPSSPPPPTAAAPQIPNPLTASLLSTQPHKFSFGIDCILGRTAAVNDAFDDNKHNIFTSSMDATEANDDNDDSKSDIEVGDCDYESPKSPFRPTVSC